MQMLIWVLLHLFHAFNDNICLVHDRFCIYHCINESNVLRTLVLSSFITTKDITYILRYRYHDLSYRICEMSFLSILWLSSPQIGFFLLLQNNYISGIFRGSTLILLTAAEFNDPFFTTMGYEFCGVLIPEPIFPNP